MTTTAIPEVSDDTSVFDWDHLFNLAGKVASTIADRWDVVEADDVRQEMLEHLLRRRKHIAHLVTNDDILRKIFLMTGHSYAIKERAYRDMVDDEYYYTTDEARHALRQLAHTRDEFGDTVGKRDDLSRCSITDNIHTACMEAEKGLEYLNPRYRKLLVEHYVLGYPLENAADRKACQRGAIALSREMNRSIRKKKPGV